MKQSSFVPLHGEGRQLIHKGGGGGERKWMTKVFEELLGWSHFQFSVESKSILLWFPLLHSVIGPQNSHHSPNQSDAKLKTIATLSFAFSRASGSLLVSTWSPHWLLMTSIFFLINSCDNFCFGFKTFN